MTNIEEQRARLALLASHKINRRLFQQLISQTASIQSLLSADAAYWQTLGLNPEQRAALANPDWAKADQQLAWRDRDEQHHLIFFDDPSYPPLLHRIEDAPPLLWARGDIRCLSEPQVAIVGSRNATSGGEQNAHAFAQQLAEHGITITSGLATGIDAQAHLGALSSTQGHTLAVLGTGVDLVYPARNKSLAERIVLQGLVVSEFPLGTKAQAWHFPQRNRIISGLSLGVLVVEAAEKSGSLITAYTALEQGREVFALPGSIHNPLAKGCHQLIKRGHAKLTETVSDILSELTEPLKTYLAPTLDPQQQAFSEELSPAAQSLLQQIPYDPIDMDQLLLNTQISAQQAASLLLELELSDSVEIYGGNKVARIR